MNPDVRVLTREAIPVPRAALARVVLKTPDPRFPTIPPRKLPMPRLTPPSDPEILGWNWSVERTLNCMLEKIDDMFAVAMLLILIVPPVTSLRDDTCRVEKVAFPPNIVEVTRVLKVLMLPPPPPPPPLMLDTLRVEIVAIWENMVLLVMDEIAAEPDTIVLLVMDETDAVLMRAVLILAVLTLRFASVR